MARSPDGWIRWYYAVREDCGAPALDHVESRGWVLAERCSNCGGRARQLTKEGFYVCTSCTIGKGRERRATPWPYVERLLLKGEVQDSLRPGTFEHRVSRQVDIAVLLSRMLKDPMFEQPAKLYVANVMGHSIRDLCDQGPKTWPDWGLSWSFRSVREHVNEGRGEWTARLDAAGIDYDRDFN